MSSLNKVPAPPVDSARKISLVAALREALREEMRRDESVILLGEDIGVEGGFGGAFTVTLGLAEEFGHRRVIDTPISDRKSTRLNSSHGYISYAVFCLKKKNNIQFSYLSYMDQSIHIHG